MEKKQETRMPGRTVVAAPGTVQRTTAVTTLTTLPGTSPGISPMTTPETTPGTTPGTTPWMTPGPTPRGSIALIRKPTHGILKITSTQAVPLPPEMSRSRRKSQRWDEMNILATYHPPGKDYGLMKVDEPKTPFNRILDDDTEEDRPTGGTFLNPVTLTPELLAERLAALDGISPKALKAVEGRSRTRVQDSPDRKAEFLSKRKAHYTEGRYLGHTTTDDSQSDDAEEATEGVHYRLAQQLLEQERKPKDDPEDMEILAPILSVRSSLARTRIGSIQLQGKQTFLSKNPVPEAHQAELKGLHRPERGGKMQVTDA